MVIISLQLEECIGCNYCSEVAPSYFQMNEDDGKSELIESLEKRGFHTLKTHDPSAFDECRYAEESCPVNIIKTKMI